MHFVSGWAGLTILSPSSEPAITTLFQNSVNLKLQDYTATNMNLHHTSFSCTPSCLSLEDYELT